MPSTLDRFVPSQLRLTNQRTFQRIEKQEDEERVEEIKKRTRVEQLKKLEGGVQPLTSATIAVSSFLEIVG